MKPITNTIMAILIAIGSMSQIANARPCDDYLPGFYGCDDNGNLCEDGWPIGKCEDKLTDPATGDFDFLSYNMETKSNIIRPSDGVVCRTHPKTGFQFCCLYEEGIKQECWWE